MDSEDKNASFEPIIGRYQDHHIQMLHVPTCPDYDEV